MTDKITSLESLRNFRSMAGATPHSEVDPNLVPVKFLPGSRPNIGIMATNHCGTAF